MMQQTAEEDLVERIIRFIETLGYEGMETLEPNWVQSVLIDASPARDNFMVWVVSQLCPTDSTDLQSAPQQILHQRLLQSFSSLGLCKARDTALIEGSTPAINQLRFWRACLEKISQIGQISKNRRRHQRASFTHDMLLDHLAHSSHLNQILKDTGANVIPGDLRKRYKASYKDLRNIPLSDLLQETDEEIAYLQKEYSAVDKRWKAASLLTTNNEEEQGQEQRRLCNSVAGLNKQQDLFQGVYTSYIVPWGGKTPQLELPNTGEIVHEATSKLLDLTKVLKSVDEVSQKCNELADQDKQMKKNISHPSTIMSMLQSIVTQESIAKSALATKE